jgi:hypothetical protein
LPQFLQPLACSIPEQPYTFRPLNTLHRSPLPTAVSFHRHSLFLNTFASPNLSIICSPMCLV